MAKIYLGKEETVELIKEIIGTMSDGPTDVINNTLMAKAKYLLQVLENGIDDNNFGTPIKIVSDYKRGTKVTGKGYLFVCGHNGYFRSIYVDGKPISQFASSTIERDYNTVAEKIPFKNSVEVRTDLGPSGDAAPIVAVCY